MDEKSQENSFRIKITICICEEKSHICRKESHNMYFAMQGNGLMHAEKSNNFEDILYEKMVAIM